MKPYIINHAIFITNHHNQKSIAGVKIILCLNKIKGGVVMDKKEYFEKILDRSIEELVKELFPKRYNNSRKDRYKRAFRICCRTDYESGKKFLSRK
jgi:pyruvoyl-dependent arginine decarboxylase (PvlArgDC)